MFRSLMNVFFILYKFMALKIWQYFFFVASLGVSSQTPVSKQHRYIDVLFYFIKRKIRYYKFCAKLLVDKYYSEIADNVVIQ